MSDKRREIEAEIARKFEESHSKYDTKDDTDA
jgi:hypothetical protein